MVTSVTDNNSTTKTSVITADTLQAEMPSDVATLQSMVMNLSVKLINYRHLSKTVYLADNEDGFWREIIETTDSPGLAKCDVWTQEHMPSSNSRTTNKSRRVARDRHRKAYNALYADWHVERISSHTTLEEQEAIEREFEMWRFRKR
jgi:prepilin-type processing-associated H-X9-DG protein